MAETAVALQWRSVGSAPAAAAAAGWRQRSVSGGSSTVGRALAGGGGSLAVVEATANNFIQRAELTLEFEILIEL
jgi:ABC-type uncharacterized transport system permease subunit